MFLIGEDENGKGIYEDLTIAEQEVFAVVILTSVYNNEYCNRGGKGDKQTIALQKMQPAYSFKTPW